MEQMKKLLLCLIILFLSVNSVISQDSLNTVRSDSIINLNNYKIKSNVKYTPKEPQNNWSLNLIFSDNGFGVGATLFKSFNADLSGFASLFFSGAKDGREFDVTDIYGNTYTPYKINRLYMAAINLGLQYRLFREDVSDNLRPFINGGLTPTSIIYLPYQMSIIPSLGYMRAKYTLGGFFGVGMDYLTNNSSALSLNIRYYYINLFGEGVQSLQDKPKNFFGGLYFVFSFNFLK